MESYLYKSDLFWVGTFLNIVSIIWELKDFDCFDFYFMNPTKIKIWFWELTSEEIVIFIIVFYFGYFIADIKLLYYSE